MTEVQSYQRENCQLQKPLHLVCTGRTLHYKIFGVNLSVSPTWVLHQIKCLLQLDYRKINICVTHADSHDWLQELITRGYSLVLSSHLITLGLRLNWATVAICIYICQATTYDV